ncbi:MAG TPA: sulfotransferase domain-containing protein [Candidatus Limnocylindrales bacterium]|nr:sulfotransferase domain-containing protein [Candidatus Limnocylindrales bacterium]
MRHYHGFMADSARWQRFQLRPDDVVITTPAKCGTTWTQQIVGMLLRDTVTLPPIGTISPWLDMLVRSEELVFSLLDAQTERRFIKTHTPLDGLPFIPSVTYIAVIRHPLDVALSDRDHMANLLRLRAAKLREEAVGEFVSTIERESPPDDPADFLRWFIDNHEQPTGSGPYGLEDYCQQIRTYWDARAEPNVHLFHYDDLWNDLDGQMRRVAAILGVSVDEARWPEFRSAATLDSMRARATDTAPDVELGLWQSPTEFFRVGGSRDWASLLTPDDVAHFNERLRVLAGDATDWVLSGGGGMVAGGISSPRAMRRPD